jgi:hypothetical protein
MTPPARTGQAVSRQYLIQDPHHEYAVRFIDHLFRKHGHRAVCFYTDRAHRLRQEREFQILASDRIAASYDVPLDELETFAQHVRAHYDIAGIIPFNEPAVLPAAQLAALLDLDCPQQEVMPRFRDKHAMKEHLRGTAGLRVNRSQRVTSIDDILDARARVMPRFVLKPNDGYGNRAVGIFDKRSTRDEIDKYLERARGRQLVMEEFVGGQEYFVNGQVDARGNVSVVAAFAYERAAANGHPQIDAETWKVPHASAVFSVLAEYAQAVLIATGLRRSPFHLELKIDEQGPCLIEVGARFAGLKNVFLCERLHGSLDLFDVAAHYYLHADDYGPLALDWTAYDARAIRYVHGISTQRHRVYDVSNVRTVERLPHFLQWAKKPVLGERVEITHDCLSAPWSVILAGASESELDTAAKTVRDYLQPQAGVSISTRALVSARAAMTKAIVGVDVRVRSALTKNVASNSAKQPRFSPMRLLVLGSKIFDSAVRRAQLLGIGAAKIQPLLAPITPRQALTVQATLEWGGDYLGKAHPDLGRKGAICPFIKQTIALGQLFVSVHEGIDGRSSRTLRRIVLDEAQRYEKLCPMDNKKAAFSGIVVALPDCAPGSFDTLDRVHAELKTHLMRHDLMFSAFHPHSRKPSVANAKFHAFKAPFAAFVIRRVDVRDIAFLGHNRRAFARYYERFAPLFRERQVSNEFSYVRLFEQACERFGFVRTTQHNPVTNSRETGNP